MATNSEPSTSSSAAKTVAFYGPTDKLNGLLAGQVPISPGNPWPALVRQLVTCWAARISSKIVFAARSARALFNSNTPMIESNATGPYSAMPATTRSRRFRFEHPLLPSMRVNSFPRDTGYVYSAPLLFWVTRRCPFMSSHTVVNQLVRVQAPGAQRQSSRSCTASISQ